jgi:hypothetical protein
MSLPCRAVDQHFLRRTIRRCQGMEDVLPDTFGCAADEAIVEGPTRAVDARGVDPASAGLQNMNDPSDNAAIIDPWLAAPIARKMRLMPRELFLAQPEIISIHQWSSFEGLASQNVSIGNPVYGSGAKMTS